MSEQRIELTIRREGHPDMTVPLPKGSIHIGRAEDNGLVLPDIAVSRRHARLHVTKTGVSIEDVGSGNGTYFEGKPLRKRDLLDGDEVVIDPFMLVFSVPNAPDRESTETSKGASAGPPRVAGVPKLVLVHGHGLKPEYLVRDAGLSMGRAEQRDIILPDPAASRSHADIVPQGDRWVLRDGGSVNGTFINTKRVREHVLVDGDRIRIGATEFRYEEPELPHRDGLAPAPQEPPGTPSPGTRPFENLIFGLDSADGQMPPGLGSDQTYVPKGRVPAPPSPPTLNAGAPPPPGSGSVPSAGGFAPPPPPPSPGSTPLPGDAEHFETRKILPAVGAPAHAPPVVAAPPPRPTPVAAPPPAMPPPMISAPVPAPSIPPPPGNGAPAPFAAPAPTPSAPPPQSGFAPPPQHGLAPPPQAGLAPPPTTIPMPGPSQGFAPLAPPPTAAAPPSAAGGGFGGVEMDMGAGGKRKKGRRGKKMKMSGGGGRGGGARSGSFMQRNIGMLTGGILVMAVFLFAVGFIKNNMSDTRAVTRIANRANNDDVPAVTSAEAGANKAAVDSLIVQGNALFADQKFLEAVEKYASVQVRDPNNAIATKMGYHACEFMVVQHMFDTISGRSTTMAEQQEAYDAALAQADDALSRRGNLTAAQKAIEAVMEYFPEDEALQNILDDLKRRRRGVAVAVRKRKQEEHQASIEDLFAAAQSDRSRGDDMAAITGFERVLGADPEKQTELYWKAEEQIRQIKAELSARGRQAYRAGLSAMKSGDYITARAQFRETLRLDPFNQVAQRRLDEVQAKLDQQAQKYWSEAEIYEKTNQLEMAIGRYRKVMEYCASSSSPLSQKAKKRIDALMR